MSKPRYVLDTDSIIAATAVAIKGILLSNDSDFRTLNIPGFTVRNIVLNPIP